MVTPFSTFSGSNTSTLTDALLAPNSSIVITSNSIVLKSSGQDAVNFYDGSLTPLGIGSGLLLTSGTTPGTSNTVGYFGSDNSVTSGFYNGDADINAVVNSVFQTQSYDATTLSFDFNVTDSTATSISFDLVFGSDEYPEWVDAFVDSAIVMVNGVNYALFNNDPNRPLSVISANLTAGYFQDNANNVLPIEYDGVSYVLKIIAPINSGTTNHIKIGIADTGDHVYDSGIFISNLSAGNIPGSGVVTTPNSGTDNSDNLTGSSKNEYFDLKGGDDICYAGAGDDIIVGGAGKDAIYGGSGNDEIKGDGGDDILDGGDSTTDTVVYSGSTNEYNIIFNAVDSSYTITDNKTDATSEGKDTVTNIELAKFSNGLFALTPTGLSSVVNPNPTPTNTPGLVLISGVTSAGNVLTATVSDPDGISSGINYQWQTSSDNGVTWSNVGSDSNTYTVTSADIGTQVQVIANYIDNATISESPVSLPVDILQTKTGDLFVTLLNLKAPVGSSTINPLTTLVQDAIDLGLSPNTAAMAIKNVLGLPSDIQLQSYDAYGVLQSDPTNANALAVEKVAVQIAILTSLSDDDTGLNLTSAIINAATNNQTLDLGNVNDLSSIIGVPAIIDPITNKYPQPLQEILDRNKTISEAIADGGNVSVIENVWQDLLSIQDQINSTSIADLSIHVNQAPIGTATATLPEGTEGSPYILNTNNLLAGFTDPEGDILSVTNLSANISGTFFNNQNGTWTFTPSITNYNGPVELTYSVTDQQGANTSANQLFIIAPNAVSNTINGTTGNDKLTGSTNNDEINGLAGNDNIQGLTGNDTLNGGEGNDDLQGNQGNDLIYGGNGNDTVRGGQDNDTLDGGIGADSMVGGLGDDLYGVDNTLDRTVELTNQGIDSVNSSITYTLGANLENLSLSGTANINGGGNTLNNVITGNSGNNFLNGGSGNDTFIGGAGNDTLSGGTDADSMVGGLGDDLYGVDNTGDVVVELANEGIDTVNSSVTYTLGVNLENLTLSGTGNINGGGNTLNNVIRGNTGNNFLNGGSGNDTFIGGAGNDTLSGGTGADSMVGGLGDDLYGVDNTGDVIVELANQGIDTVNTSVTYIVGANLENLSLSGTANINGTGNTLNNVITGNSGNNILTGEAGNDTLTGGGGNDTLIGSVGNDTLTGGTGLDSFRFNSPNEGNDAEGTLRARITDFNVTDDTLRVLGSGFGGGLAVGTLLSNQFTLGVSATTSAHRFFYNSSNGSLFFDVDGSGATSAVQIATLNTGLAMTNADIVVI